MDFPNAFGLLPLFQMCAFWFVLRDFPLLLSLVEDSLLMFFFSEVLCFCVLLIRAVLFFLEIPLVFFFILFLRPYTMAGRGTGPCLFSPYSFVSFLINLLYSLGVLVLGCALLPNGFFVHLCSALLISNDSGWFLCFLLFDLSKDLLTFFLIAGETNLLGHTTVAALWTSTHSKRYDLRFCMFIHHSSFITPQYMLDEFPRLSLVLSF